MRFIQYIFVFVALTGCGKSSEKGSVNNYFDISSFIENQVNILKKENPEVTKNWKFNHKTKTEQLKDIDWSKELKYFSDSDINKSSYVTSYDSVRSGNTLTYRLKPSENLPVKEITILYDSDGHPNEISSIKTSENYFFSTYSNIRLQLEKQKLKEYSILSTQKLLWFRPDSSSVQGAVVGL